MITKAVLRAIDDAGAECYKSQKTIAREVQAVRETVNKAIKKLERMSLITVVLKKNRYGVTTNHYRLYGMNLAIWYVGRPLRPL